MSNILLESPIFEELFGDRLEEARQQTLLDVRKQILLETLKIVGIVRENLEICPDREDLMRLGLSAIYELNLKKRADRIKVMDMIDGSFGAGVMEGYAKTPYTEIWQHTNEEVAERMKVDAEGYLAEVQAELVANKLNRICLEYGFGKYTLRLAGIVALTPIKSQSGQRRLAN
jgi:hypothetical protein